MSYKQRSPVIVAEGGTGAVTLTSNGVLLGNGASAVTATTPGTTGQILTGVTGSAPTFQSPAASSISITGDTGGALTGNSFTFTGGTTGLAFGGSGSTETLTFAGITANGGTVSLATDATASTINVGTGGGAKTSTFGSVTSTSATTVQSGSGALNITATNGALTINSGTGALGVSTDASATTVSLATGGAVKTTTLGSVNSTSATTVQSGSGALNVTATNGALTINSGTGALSISNDASATTVNIASGGAAKVVQLGSTNGASSLALKYGTADFSLASATGTVMSALDTGEITQPLQPCFAAFLSATASNVTGDNTNYTIICDQETIDQNSDYNNATGVFTAPVTGKYFFSANCTLSGIGVSTTASFFINSPQATLSRYNPSAIADVTFGQATYSCVWVASMSASDTCSMSIQARNTTLTVDVQGDGSFAQTNFCGYLIC